MPPDLPFLPAREALGRLAAVDLHSHSTFVDGADGVAEMIAAARAAGLEYFALTEHVRGSAVRWWDRYVAEIKAARRDAGLHVLIGMEANAIGPAGTVDVTEQMWRDAEIVLGSVHGYYHDETWEKIPDGALPREAALAYEVEKTLGLARNPRIHVLAHPGYIFERHYGGFPADALRAIVAEAKATGTAVEMTYPFMADPEGYFRVLLAENPLVSIGSNAHRKEHVGGLASVLAPVLTQQEAPREGGEGRT